MNCECIYYSKTATLEDYEALAKVVKRKGEFLELYPISISRINERCKVCEDYNGWGEHKSIPKYSLVLFVGGKLHYMNEIKVGRRVFRAFHPMDYPVFTDLVDCECEEGAL